MEETEKISLKAAVREYIAVAKRSRWDWDAMEQVLRKHDGLPNLRAVAVATAGLILAREQAKDPRK